MSLPSENVTAQAFGFATCAGESTYSGEQNDIYGDKKCYEHDQQRAMFYWWATDVMERTPQTGDDCNCGKCVTDEFACSVITLLSPGCIQCGCGSESDRPISCDITYNETVYQAADADQETVLPNVAGRTTLIISNQTPVTNNWSQHVGEIATDDGSANFTYSLPPVGDVILDAATSTYYVAYTGGAGPLYPPIDGNLVFLNLTLFSRFPGVTAQYNRNVAVETSPDGVTWTVVYFGPESALLTGYTAVVSDSPTLTRSTYYYGEEDTCIYTYADGSVPPFVAPPCGILLYDITPNSTCGTENWTISIDFTQIDGWNIGTVTPNINGTPGTAQAIALGTLTFGPFRMGDLVTFTLENNIDVSCNETTNTFFDPRVVEQDYNVLRAVDANEYATLSGDGEDYYIVSNVDNLVANWGLHVGEIWNGGSSTYTNPANLDIVYASNPGGALGFWQDDAGTPKQLFPQPTFTYNTVTLIATSSLPPVAPYTQGWVTLFIQALWTPPAGSPVTVFNGTPDAFVPNGFSIPNTTTWGAVTGFAAYSEGCAVRVPAITNTFTPTGPDPDFSEIGVNAGVNSLGAGPNGSFYIGGFFDHYDATGANIPANSFTRLNSDGTLDVAFNAVVTDLSASAPGFNSDLRDLAVDAFGRIVCVGSFTTFNDVSRPHIARINTDGTLDTTFVVGTGFNSTVTGVSIDSSNRVICTGGFTQYNGVFVGYCVRLNTDGSIDTTFNYNNGLTPPAPYAGFNGNTYRNLIDSDNTIIVNSGQGSFDAYTDQTGTTIAIPSWTPYKKALVRLNTNGSLASLTTQGLAMNGTVAPIQNSFDIQPNGDIICVGAFTTYGTNTVNRIVRMDSTGNIDTAFLANTDPGFDSLNAQTAGIAVLPNGQILVGCAAGDDYQGGFTGGLIRLNTDGTLDNTFNIGTGFTGGTGPIVIDILVTTLGDIIVSGVFTALDGTPRFYVAKF